MKKVKKEKTADICRKCKYYLQHYVYVSGGYRWAYLGHCTRGRLQPRRPDAKACELYKEKSPEQK